ncbi:MAG: hypothetical protein PWP37_1429 [Thermotogota bacterium]|nr:hypothetical protein [Thermotogota bacterium]
MSNLSGSNCLQARGRVNAEHNLETKMCDVSFPSVVTGCDRKQRYFSCFFFPLFQREVFGVLRSAERALKQTIIEPHGCGEILPLYLLLLFQHRAFTVSRSAEARTRTNDRQDVVFSPFSRPKTHVITRLSRALSVLLLFPFPITHLGF